MTIAEVLEQKRSLVQSKWIDSVINSYPSESAKFIVGNKNKFTNPLGYTVENSINTICSNYLNSEKQNECEEAIEAIVRLRAVQDFTPAKAIGIMFDFKSIVLTEIRDMIDTKDRFDEYLLIETQIDKLIDYALNFYIECRERVNEIKANEVRRGFEKMVLRLNSKYKKLEETEDNYNHK